MAHLASRFVPIRGNIRLPVTFGNAGSRFGSDVSANKWACKQENNSFVRISVQCGDNSVSSFRRAEYESSRAA